MTAFRVGQRVRIVKSSYANRIGMEATITMISMVLFHIQLGPGRYCYLDVDGLGTRSPETGAILAYPASYLEPIVDANHQPCESEFKETLDKLLEGLPA